MNHSKTYLSPNEFRIFAHRGSTEGGAYENTLESFRYAVEAGVRYLETDVQATSDGVAVLFHDDGTARLLGMPGRIGQFSLRELRELSARRGFRIPTLQEALERFPTTNFNLDIKASKAVMPTVEAIKTAGAESRVLVSSFSLARRQLACSKLAGVATSADQQTFLKIYFAYKLGIKSLLDLLLHDVDALQIPISYGPFRFATAKFINCMHTRGVEVHFWTVNDTEVATRLKALGANGIVTDKGKMMLEVLSKGN